MGKHQPADTVSAKAEAPKAKETAEKAGSKPSSGAPAPKSDDKPKVAKNGGVKCKGSQKSEIDDIFSAGKQKAQKEAEGKRAAEEEAQKDAKSGRAAAGSAGGKRQRVEGSKDDIFGEAAAKGRKRTEEGFVIYTEDELGLGKKGGDTDLCPFDCDCCF